MISLTRGDCLKEMNGLEDNSIDCVIADLPYGITRYDWDRVIDYRKMWSHLKRVVKINGAICLFGREPFSSALRMSNREMFKYDWLWQKDRAANHLNAKKQPMRRIEIISVFYAKQCMYNPQFKKKDPKNVRPPTVYRPRAKIYGEMSKRSVREQPTDVLYPSELLEFNGFTGIGSLYPTQKPVDLLEYLIRTYTVEGETVLDFTMGSGSTGVACVNTERNFVGIDIRMTAFLLSRKRILDAEQKCGRGSIRPGKEGNLTVVNRRCCEAA